MTSPDLFTYAERQASFPSRDAALDALEQVRADYVTRARKVAHELLDGLPYITINTVREHCPPPKNVDPRVMGAVLRAPHFKRVGYESSDRSTCHSRPIAQFVRGDA